MAAENLVGMHVYPTHFVLSSRARFHKQWLASFARSGREQRLLSVGVPAAIIHKWPFHCSSAIFKKSSHRFGLDKNKTRRWRHTHTSEHIGKVDGHRPRIFRKQRREKKCKETSSTCTHTHAHVLAFLTFVTKGQVADWQIVARRTQLLLEVSKRTICRRCLWSFVAALVPERRRTQRAYVRGDVSEECHYIELDPKCTGPRVRARLFLCCQRRGGNRLSPSASYE